MSVFIILFLLLSIIYFGGSEKRRRVDCLLCFLLLWLVQALRSTDVGHDISNAYLPAFLSLDNVDLSLLFKDTIGYSFEIGFQAYLKIVKLITNNVNVFLAISSFIILAPVAYNFYKYSRKPELSFIIFASVILYHFSFSGLRQAIAVSLCFLTYSFIIKRRLLPFLLFVILAFYFHKSALVFLPAYFLYGLKFDVKSFIIVAIALVIVFMYVDTIAEFFRDIIFGDTAYSGYMDDKVASFGLTILYVLMAVFLFVFSDKKDVSHSFLCWMSVMVLVFQPLALISQVADRVGYYYLIFFSLSIPNVISQSPTLSKGTKSLISPIIIVLMIAFFFYCNAGGYLEVIPYKFFWQ